MGRVENMTSYAKFSEEKQGYDFRLENRKAKAVPDSKATSGSNCERGRSWARPLNRELYRAWVGPVRIEAHSG
jgi:hypothetical protein